MTTSVGQDQVEGGLFSRDFDELTLDDTYESEPRAIGESDVQIFAALTGDHHPIHVDPEWASRGPFGEPIAHGLLVVSCAVGALPLDPDRVLALRRFRDLVFKRPLVVGDAVTVRCTVTGSKPIDAGTGLVECDWRILGSDGRLRARAVVEILWRRSADAAERAARAERVAPLKERPDDEPLTPVMTHPEGTVQVLI